MCAWFVTALLLGNRAATAQAAPEQMSVLILLPGQPGLPAATAIASGIRAALLTDWAFRVTVEMEHVDIARFQSSDVEERRLRTIYRSKYRNQRFDVIVAALPEPFRFVLRARDDLWPGTPVVVCGVDERSVRDLKPPPGFAVLTTRFDMEGTVRAALTLLPDTRHVALVGGASQPEQVYHDLIRQAVIRAGSVDVIDLTKLPIAGALARVSSLPEHTVIIQSSYQVDGDGRRFYGIDLVPHVSAAANRPVFTPLGLALGRGVVGGSIVEFEDIGRDAARMATQLLRGVAAPATLMPSLATATLRFDARQLARWRLDERRLPEDSQVFFRERTLWQQYRWHVAAAAGLIAAQATLIVTLLVQRRRRREAEAAAQRLLGQLAHFDRVARLGELASSLAHELNQPLTAILTSAQAAKRLLAKPEVDLEELRACIADVIDDDHRASEVIRHMRGLLKRTSVVTVPLALNDLAANTIGLVANDALSHAVTVEFRPAADLPVVHGDSVQIQQVILNLLTNAITAVAHEAPLNRSVTVWTAVTTAPWIELCVRDSGKGIPDADLGRIFEPFFTTNAEGLGMGLSISRTIIEAHNGRLLVENDPAGGATFRVQLRTDRPRRSPIPSSPATSSA